MPFVPYIVPLPTSTHLSPIAAQTVFLDLGVSTCTGHGYTREFGAPILVFNDSCCWYSLRKDILNEARHLVVGADEAVFSVPVLYLDACRGGIKEAVRRHIRTRLIIGQPPHLLKTYSQ